MADGQAGGIAGKPGSMKRPGEDAWCGELDTPHNVGHTGIERIAASIEGRLPMVLCEPQIRVLESIGKKLDCRLADILFVVFGMVINGGAMRDTLEPLPLLEPEMLNGSVEKALEDCVAYAFQIPQRVLRRTDLDGSADGVDSESTLDEVSFPDTMARVAFVYLRRRDGEDRLMCQAVSLRDDRLRQHAFDLVIEVTEFNHHVLIECFFCPKLIAHHVIARLLFQYACGLHDVESLLTSGVGFGDS